MKLHSRSLLIAWALISIPVIVVLALSLQSNLKTPTYIGRQPSSGRLWTPAMIDSLARGAELPAPPGGARDSAWYAMLANNASKAERFWYNQARLARGKGNTLFAPPDSLALQHRGLAEPPEALRADLVRHPELIPYRSTEGGFQFFPERAILLPGGCWVCAYFEDGMTDGHVLLKYEVKGNGTIVWTRIASKWEH